MAKTFLISSDFMGKTAELAVGCAAIATGMVVMPVAAPALGVAGILGGAALSKLIRQKPDCEAAVAQILKTTSREFAPAHEADAAAVRAAERALRDALTADLFTADRLREAWTRSDRVAEGMAALALEGVERRDPSFAEPGIRRDLAQDVLERVFAAAVTACSAFREMATLTGVETLVGGQRGLDERFARIEQMLQDRAGLTDEQVRRVLERFGETLGDQPVNASEYETRLLALADQFVKQVVQAQTPTNDAPDISAKRQAAAAALKDSEFEKAEALFAEIADIHLETGRRDVLAAAAATAEQGGAARLRGDLLDSAALYGRAADLSQVFDADASWSWRFSQADILDDHGNMFPGPSQAEAVRIWRDICLPHTPRDTHPIEWAGTQNCLSVALQKLGARAGGEEGVRILMEAVAAAKLASEVHTRAEMPDAWVLTQNSLAVALATLGERSGGETSVKAFADAVTAFRAGVEAHDRTENPTGWATAQHNLGNALATLAARAGGERAAEAQAEAVEAFRASLEVLTRAEAPDDWAMTQNNLGNVLRDIGEREQGSAGLAALLESIAAYEGSLDVRTRETMPVQWAMTQNNLGNAVRTLSNRLPDEERIAALSRSIGAYEAALEVRDRSSMPGQWAMTKNNLGVSLKTMGELVGGPSGVQLVLDAIEAFEDALSVYTQADNSADWAQTTANLCVAGGSVSLLIGDPELAQKGAELMLLVIAEFETMNAELWLERAFRIRENLLEICRVVEGDGSD